MNKKFFNLFLVLLLFVGLLTGCKKEDMSEYTADAYGIVYNNYVAKAIVTVQNNKVKKITIDEALLPSEWAITNYDKEHEYIVSYNDQKYLKNIKIGDIVLSYKNINDRVTYGNDTIESLDLYLRSEKNAKWYYDALFNNKITIVDDKNNVITDLKFAVTNLFKSVANYWPKDENTLGWRENISELIKGMEETNLEVEPKKDANGKVVFNNVTTKATLVGYMEYYKLAKTAYVNALNMIKK